MGSAPAAGIQKAQAADCRDGGAAAAGVPLADLAAAWSPANHPRDWRPVVALLQGAAVAD